MKINLRREDDDEEFFRGTDTTEFLQTSPGFKYAGIEDFKEDLLKITEDMLKQKHELLQKFAAEDNVELTEQDGPPLPVIVQILFDDMSGGKWVFMPKNDRQKLHTLAVIKKSLDIVGGNSGKKIIFLGMFMEAWVTSVKTNVDSKDKNLTPEQLKRKYNRQYQENKQNMERKSAAIYRWQAPITEKDAEGKEFTYTREEIEIYELFEGFIPQKKEASSFTDWKPGGENQNEAETLEITKFFNPDNGEIEKIIGKTAEFATFSLANAFKYIQNVLTAVRESEKTASVQSTDRT